MMEEIFVAILCVFALGVGVWTWWYENYSPGEMPERKESGETKVENDQEERGNCIMNIIMYILIGLMALIGGGSTIYIVISFVGILCQKIYRKIRFGASLYD